MTDTYEELDDANRRLNTELDDLEGTVEELEEENLRLDRENDALTRELKVAYELIKKSGVIPDTPENQWAFSFKGLCWTLLKYEVAQ